MAGDRVADPEAQAAVTDFLDYTEYLPSDLLRSLTLIRGLDHTYLASADAIHGLAKQYGTIPNLEPTMRPDAQGLRLQISAHLNHALSSRETAYAEACRLFDVADRHQNRLKSIIAKLNAIPKPPSRNPSPVQADRSPQKVVATALLSRPRGRRITVPGEVMPPYDPDEAIASTEVSDWGSPPPSPPRPMLKLKQVRPPKERAEGGREKPVRAPREHVSYRKPTPPPDDAELGGKFRPWTHLTEYEMYKLRKKMKKNHEWEPSQVMIRRELESRGRGWDNYYKAKAEAEKNGTSFILVDDNVLPKSEKPEPKSARAKPATKKAEAKKDKKADPARDRAAAAAQEAELAARRLGDIGSAFKNLFSPLSSALATLNRSTSSPEPPQPSAGTIKIPLKLKVTGPPPSSTQSPATTPVSATRVASAAAPSTARSSVALKTEEPTSPPPLPPPDEVMAPAAAASPAPAALPAPARRTSARTTPATTTARQTPAAEGSPPMHTAPLLPTAASRRPKREIPGTMMQTNQDGGAAVSVSRRKTKPVKTPRPAHKSSTSATNSSPEIRVDADGNKEVIDPDEERYCICGDVSYGEMICCEMDEKCENGQWFHMECVGLVEMPGRTVKWYCPGDRKKYKKGENSNGLVGRGIK
ncbi:hypothetical protein DV736_g5585, partial [Chaetothyriales sp. CBS 134916]